MQYIQEIITFIEKHIILGSIWLLLLIMIIYTIINNIRFKNSEILCDTAILLINKKNAIVIDIRDRSDYLTGHITNSVHLSLDRIKNNDIFELNKFKNHPLIIVDQNNTFSHSAKKYLKKMGFSEIYILSGGIINWTINNLPLLKNH